MSPSDYAEELIAASNSLRDWFQSQNLTAAQSVHVCEIYIIRLMHANAKGDLPKAMRLIKKTTSRIHDCVTSMVQE